MTSISQPGANSFLELGDTPNSYAGQGGKGVSVNGGESGLEFSAAGGVVPSFASNEIPSGTIDGSNDTFTLANTPAASSLALFRNGARMKAGGEDFSLSGATITFVTAAIPQPGDLLLADYRY